MPDRIVYFSTNTLIAYLINEHYYSGRHFVYCTPYFSKHPDPSFPTPSSSSPKVLYQRFSEESQSEDQAALTIEHNRIGLAKGVGERLKSNIISSDISEEILKVIEDTSRSDFKPKLYIIPADGVKDIIKKVEYTQKANKFFDEFYIENLTHDKFIDIEL